MVTDPRIHSRVVRWKWVSGRMHVATALFPRNSLLAGWIGVCVGFRCFWTYWWREIFLFF